MTEPLWATFEVTISTDRYAYSGKRTNAEMRLKVPRDVLESLDATHLFQGLVRAALVEYDSAEEKNDDETIS